MSALVIFNTFYNTGSSYSVSSAFWKAAVWMNSSHCICMHLMLSSVVRCAISPAASVSQHHGQLLLFSIQRDSGWFQHYGQLPTLYYSGSWSELILAWKSGVSLLTNPCPLHRTCLILSYFKLCALYSKGYRRGFTQDKKQNSNTFSEWVLMYIRIAEKMNF